MQASRVPVPVLPSLAAGPWLSLCSPPLLSYSGHYLVVLYPVALLKIVSNQSLGKEAEMLDGLGETH